MGLLAVHQAPDLACCWVLPVLVGWTGGGFSLGVSCSEPSLWSVCSGSLCSGLSFGWGLPPGEWKTSLSESSESVSGESGSVGSSGSFCGGSTIVGGVTSSSSDS